MGKNRKIIFPEEAETMLPRCGDPREKCFARTESGECDALETAYPCGMMCPFRKTAEEVRREREQTLQFLRENGKTRLIRFYRADTY